MPRRNRQTIAEEDFVNALDMDGLARVRALIHLRWQRFEQEAARDRRLAEELARRPRPPRGRPRRTDVERAAVVAALALHEGSVRAGARALGIPRTTLARHAKTIADWAWAYGPALVEEHARLLHESGVTPEVARLRGYMSAVQTSEARGGLLVPIWGVHGRRAWHQIRFDAPRGRCWRFLNSPDAQAIVDVSPAGRARVLDREQTLYITEGPRKADAAVSFGYACVDCPGIRMLCLDDETWNYIGVRDRDVRIVFDADAGTKGDVGAAETSLANYLVTRGARVTVLRLPFGGLDDYLASGGRLLTLPAVTQERGPTRMALDT